MDHMPLFLFPYEQYVENFNLRNVVNIYLTVLRVKSVNLLHIAHNNGKPRFFHGH